MKPKNIIIPYFNNDERGRIKEKTAEDIHHLFCRSRGGTNDDINKIPLYRNTIHRSVHNLFGNLVFPEQVLRLKEMSKKALRPELIKLVEELFSDPDMGYYFKDGVFRRD